MELFEFLMVLVSIIIGLAIADLLVPLVLLMLVLDTVLPGWLIRA